MGVFATVVSKHHHCKQSECSLWALKCSQDSCKLEWYSKNSLFNTFTKIRFDAINRTVLISIFSACFCSRGWVGVDQCLFYRFYCIEFDIRYLQWTGAHLVYNNSTVSSLPVTVNQPSLVRRQSVPRRRHINGGNSRSLPTEGWETRKGKAPLPQSTPAILERHNACTIFHLEVQSLGFMDSARAWIVTKAYIGSEWRLVSLSHLLQQCFALQNTTKI